MTVPGGPNKTRAELRWAAEPLPRSGCVEKQCRRDGEGAGSRALRYRLSPVLIQQRTVAALCLRWCGGCVWEHDTNGEQKIALFQISHFLFFFSPVLSCLWSSFFFCRDFQTSQVAFRVRRFRKRWAERPAMGVRWAGSFQRMGALRLSQGCGGVCCCWFDFCRELWSRPAVWLGLL